MGLRHLMKDGEVAAALSDQAARIAELLAADEVRVRDISRLTVERDASRAECEGLRAAREKADTLIDEGLEILVGIIDNVKRWGNYSPESTCIFIDQAGAAFREARAALSRKETGDAT